MLSAKGMCPTVQSQKQTLTGASSESLKMVLEAFARENPTSLTVTKLT